MIRASASSPSKRCRTWLIMCESIYHPGLTISLIIAQDTVRYAITRSRPFRYFSAVGTDFPVPRAAGAGTSGTCRYSDADAIWG